MVVIIDLGYHDRYCFEFASWYCLVNGFMRRTHILLPHAHFSLYLGHRAFHLLIDSPPIVFFIESLFPKVLRDHFPLSHRILSMKI